MTLPAPPSDLNRSERKAFRNLAQRLAERGIDPIARATLIAETVRLEARLLTLRDTEKEAETGSKLAAARAVTTATSELRRINADLFRGAEKPKLIVSQDDDEPEADRAWRAKIWRGDRSRSHDDLTRAYGSPSWAALLHPTHAEWTAWQALVDEFSDRQRIPQSRISQLRNEMGGALGPEHFAPNRRQA